MKKQVFIYLFMVVSIIGNAQTMLKPSDINVALLPTWAQLMYSENPNLIEVQHEYNAYFRVHEFEKTYHTQYYKRWLRNNEAFMNAEGFIVRPTAEEQRIEFETSPGGLMEKSSGDWQLVGPHRVYDVGGEQIGEQSNIYCIDRAEDLEGYMYCGTETGEVYRSDDGGDNWINVSLNANFFTGIKSIEVDPNNSDIVFVGSGYFVFKSTDAGENWSIVLTVDWYGSNEILINENDPNIVFVAANSGFYRSVDAGETWETIYTDATYDVKINTADDATVYVVKHDPVTENCIFLYSTDSGESFTVATDGWYTSTDPFRNDLGARIAVTEADPNRVYAYLIGDSKEDDHGFIGLYRSNDGGITWTLPSSPAGGPYTETHKNLARADEGWNYHQGFYNCALLASSENADQILVGGMNLYKSDDGGESFEHLAGYGPDGYEMHIDMQDFRQVNGITYVTTDGGSYRSDDFFSTSSFELIMDGIHSAEYWGFGQGWNQDVTISGVFHNGVHVQYENYPDKSFLGILDGGEPSSGFVNQGENKRVYSTQLGGRIIPESIGDPVVNAGFGIVPNNHYLPVQSSELEFDPRCYAVAYTGKDNQIWKTTDKGVTFELFHTFEGVPEDLIQYIEISRSNPDVMYVTQKLDGTIEGKIWKTSDGGVSWTEISQPTEAEFTFKALIQIDPLNENRIWVAYYLADDGMQIYRSDDGGSSWNNLSTPALYGQWVQSIAHIGGTNQGIYYFTSRNVFYRNADMDDWEEAGDGLPFRISTNIAKPFYRDGKIRLASFGKGLWESSLVEEPEAPIAQIMADRLDMHILCEGDSIFYTDYSIVNHDEASWEWTFEGGSPATSSDIAPHVYYATEGLHLTTLKVTDGDGNSDIDSIYIDVSKSLNLFVNADFESEYPSDFEIVNPDGERTWGQSLDAGGYGLSSSSSVFKSFFYPTIGATDDMRFHVDPSFIDSDYLTFDVAYAKYGGGYSDTLEILISTDCGATSTSLYMKGGTELATADDLTEHFIPTAEEWRTDSVDISAYLGADILTIIFRARNGYGNSIYIDNILLGDPVFASTPMVEKNDLNLYPNPVSNSNTLFLEGNASGLVSLTLYDIKGKIVYSGQHSINSYVNLGQLNAGTYVYHLESANFMRNGQLVIL